ncbi:hypothetical protein PpBr36_05067 [Pyricularia pennisetigena]|uniref:hypothetical protein n=1 Tax=Pyricularia pennisetigena TaxID=1578925 RepID=UPI00114E67F5|nr:hypothetical protein PpBr36_05067 [Pyricularia pennisetigena]TLS26193.1 hypothetical protein PpBr36_05067 [Pyricularia pennisetigena]
MNRSLVVVTYFAHRADATPARPPAARWLEPVVHHDALGRPRAAPPPRTPASAHSRHRPLKDHPQVLARASTGISRAGTCRSADPPRHGSSPHGAVRHHFSMWSVSAGVGTGGQGGIVAAAGWGQPSTRSRTRQHVSSAQGLSVTVARGTSLGCSGWAGRCLGAWP